MNEITILTASEIARRIRQRELSVAEVVEAFIRRIEQVNPTLNAVVVRRFDQARLEAKAANEALAHNQPVGPLHGVPVTIKEMFDVRGLPTTVGLTSRTRHRARRDAVTVARLREAGAIILGKTNVPQLGIMAESDNPVYGRTNNPWNLDRGPGGSSGGEAAIIAAGGSPLGLGSDGGGSIRFPCHVCGVCGIKPTGKRLSMLGHWLSANWPHDWAQPGPMARDVDDLILAMEVLTSDRQTWFDECPVAWHDPNSVDLRNLRIGVYEQLESLPAAPSIRRAVTQAAAALAEQGVEIISFDVPEVESIWQLYMQVFYAEGLRDIRHQLRGSVVDWRARNYMRLARLPSLSRPAVAAFAAAMQQNHIRETMGILKRPVVSAERYCQLLLKIQEFRHRFQNSMDQQRLDALLAPPSPIPAFPHGDFYANYALMYAGLFNLLSLPAGVVPITRVQGSDQVQGFGGRDFVERSMAQSQQSSVGLPVGVQVVGRWWQEHVVLAVMRALHQRFRSADDFPTVPVNGALTSAPESAANSSKSNQVE